MSSEPSDTAEIPTPPAISERIQVPLQAGSWTVEVAGLSNRGTLRANNEDHFLICRYGRFLEALDSNLPLDDQPAYLQDNGYAMAVADGMGGNAAGEVASRLAINSLVQMAIATPDWVLRFDDQSMSEKVMTRAVECAKQIKDILVQAANHDASLRGYGTTLALVWSVGKDAFVLHIGDSRVYLHRQGELRQLTRDHTVAQDLASTGLISQQHVSEHLLRHHLTRCINDSTAQVEPDVQRLQLQNGDIILICSDGLTSMVKDQSITVILERTGSARHACSSLISKALEAGGKDNVTAVVAKYKFTVAE